jgi:hypothetical protein
VDGGSSAASADFIHHRQPILSKTMKSLLLVPFGLWVLPLFGQSLPQEPSWWKGLAATGGPVSNPPAPLSATATADDFAVANIGQLRSMFDAANADMVARLSTAGVTEAAIVWPTNSLPRDDFAALNMAQLKAVAGLFYDKMRLPPLNLDARKPWEAVTGGTAIPVADDFSLVNLGQLKRAFQWELQGARRTGTGDQTLVFPALKRSLIINDLAVVDDTSRIGIVGTGGTATNSQNPNGAWHIKTLFKNILQIQSAAPALTETELSDATKAWLNTWATSASVPIPGSTPDGVAARPAIGSLTGWILRDLQRLLTQGTQGKVVSSSRWPPLMPLHPHCRLRLYRAGSPSSWSIGFSSQRF